jgi:hypothetical protein
MLCKSMESPTYLCDAFYLFLLESNGPGEKDVFCQWKASKWRVLSAWYYMQSSAVGKDVQYVWKLMKRSMHITRDH